MKNFASVVQFLLGFILGVALLLGGAAALGYVVFTRLSTPPEKPLFAEEKPKSPTKAPVKTPKPDEKSLKADPSESPAPQAEKTQETLPSGSYKAKVTWPQGLSIRAEPSTSSSRIGGIDYNTEVVILGTSNNGQWQKIQLFSNGQEGWIKSGNTEKIE